MTPSSFFAYKIPNWCEKDYTPHKIIIKREFGLYIYILEEGSFNFRIEIMNFNDGRFYWIHPKGKIELCYVTQMNTGVVSVLFPNAWEEPMYEHDFKEILKPKAIDITTPIGNVAMHTFIKEFVEASRRLE